MDSRYILKFVVEHEGKLHPLSLEMNLPVSQAAPLVGDEVQIPKSAVEPLGLTKTAFRIVRRRYVIDHLPPGVTAVIHLVLGSVSFASSTAQA